MLCRDAYTSVGVSEKQPNISVSLGQYLHTPHDCTQLLFDFASEAKGVICRLRRPPKRDDFWLRAFSGMPTPVSSISKTARYGRYYLKGRHDTVSFSFVKGSP